MDETARKRQDKIINVTQFMCFKRAIQLFNRHIEKNNTSKNYELEIFRNAAEWIMSKSVDKEALFQYISEYDYLVLALFYCLVQKNEHFSGILFKIIYSIEDGIWTKLSDYVKEYFRLSQQDLDIIVNSLCLQPSQAMTYYTKNMIEYLMVYYGAEEFFLRACTEGAVPIVRWMAESRVPIPRNALHCAAEKGHVEVAKVLLENGAKHFLTNKKFKTPLYIALMNGNLEMVKVLFKNSRNINIKHKEKKTYLHLAAKEGHCEIVEFLIQNGADISAKTESGLTALHLAIMEQHSSVAFSLINNGADVEAKCNMNKTPFQYASDKSLLLMADFLGESEYLKEAETAQGHRPLHLASSRFLLKLAKKLSEHDRTDTKWAYMLLPLRTASENKKLSADLEQRDYMGWQPLHWAAKEGQKEIIEYILTEISDVDSVTNNKENALHIAAEQGHEQVVALLLHSGIDSAKYNIYGYRAIHYAARNGHLNVVQVMNEFKVDLDCLASDGIDDNNKKPLTKPIDLAKRHNHIHIVAYLKDRIRNK